LEISELIQIFRENSVVETLNIDTSKSIESQINLKSDHFVTFDYTEKEINKILFSIYGFSYLDKKVENGGDYYYDDDDNHNSNYAN
jgi:hypothetical protein